MQNAITKDKQELERLEGIIQNNVGAFYEMGRALMEIEKMGVPGYEKEMALWKKLTAGH
jgi:hypothetical protein